MTHRTDRPVGRSETEELAAHQRVRNDATAERLRTLGTTVEPALTREEWATLNLDRRGWGVDWPKVRRSFSPHSLAAAMLYGHPFGFTREDVLWLRDLADGEGHQAQAQENEAAQRRLYDGPCDAQERWASGHRIREAFFRSIADRIAALLPPEE